RDFTPTWGKPSRGLPHGLRRCVRSGGKGPDDRLLLQTFRTLSRSDLKSVPDQDHGFSHLSGKGAHLQRQTGVTEADRTVRSEQEGQSILNRLHGSSLG